MLETQITSISTNLEWIKKNELSSFEYGNTLEEKTNEFFATE